MVENLNKSLDAIISEQKDNKPFQRQNKQYQRNQIPVGKGPRIYSNKPQFPIQKKYIRKEQFNIQEEKSNFYQQDYQKQKSRLRVYNLPQSVTNTELRELFETCGQLTRLGIDWDNLGRSKGTAIVEFRNEANALRALKEYNQAELDGNILKIMFDD